jgi:hypothetical protein
MEFQQKYHVFLNKILKMTVFMALTAVTCAILWNGPCSTLLKDETIFKENQMLIDGKCASFL